MPRYNSCFGCGHDGNQRFSSTCSNCKRIASDNFTPTPDSVLIDNTISLLDELKERMPNMKIVIDTGAETVECRIGDAIIYEGEDGSIMIDAE
jgi:hypothetical protein